MEYRKLSGAGLRASRLGLDLAGFVPSAEMRLGELQKKQLLGRALDAEILLWDLDRVDHGVETAKIIQAEFGKRRDELLLSGRIGGFEDSNPDRLAHADPQMELRKGRLDLERILRSLRSEHLDLLWFHISNPTTFENQPVVQLLSAFVKEGKVRSFGFSLGGTGAAWGFESILNVLKDLDSCPVLFPFNWNKPGPGHGLLREWLDEAGGGGAQPFSNKQSSEVEKSIRKKLSGCISRDPWVSNLVWSLFEQSSKSNASEHVETPPSAGQLAAAEFLRRFELIFNKKPGHHPVEAALAWVLCHRRLDCCLLPVQSQEQLDRLLDFAKMPPLTLQEISKTADVLGIHRK